MYTASTSCIGIAIYSTFYLQQTHIASELNIVPDRAGERTVNARDGRLKTFPVQHTRFCEPNKARLNRGALPRTSLTPARQYLAVIQKGLQYRSSP